MKEELTQEGWEERFDHKLHGQRLRIEDWNEGAMDVHELVKGFISQELTKARKEERERVERKMEINKEELLWDYSNWLHKHWYIDADFYAEEPKAVDGYLKELREQE